MLRYRRGEPICVNPDACTVYEAETRSDGRPRSDEDDSVVRRQTCCAACVLRSRIQRVTNTLRLPVRILLW